MTVSLNESTTHLVTDKAVSSTLRFEVPYHETGVHRASSKLFHIWAEANTCNSVSVALEVAL